MSRNSVFIADELYTVRLEPRRVKINSLKNVLFVLTRSVVKKLPPIKPTKGLLSSATDSWDCFITEIFKEKDRKK